MCDPLTIGIATAVLGATQQVASFVGQNALAKQNKKAANLNKAADLEKLGLQDTQLQREHSEKAFDTALAGLRSQGQIVASASDTGAASSSIAAQLNASMFGLGRSATIDELNFRGQRNELQSQRRDAELRRVNQINSVPKATVGSLVLGIAGAGLQGYNAKTGAEKAGA